MPVTSLNDGSVANEFSSYVGTSFVVGSTASGLWNLDSATLSMNDAFAGTTGAFSVGIYANQTSGVPDPRPGSLVGTLSGSASPTTASQYVYTATPGSIQLTAGQTYWLVASALSTTGTGQAYNWKMTDDTSYTSQSSGWAVDASHAFARFGTSYATDTGTWTDDNPAVLEDVVYRTTSSPAAAGSGLDFGTDQFLQFSLSATAVSAAPEPSKAAFVLLGLFGLGLRRKRPLSC